MNNEEFQKLKKDCERVALYREISSDHLTPITAYFALSKKGNCLLESVVESRAESNLEAKQGRFSFIGLDPMASFESRGRQIQIKIGNQTERFEADPYDALRNLQKRMRTAVVHPIPVFTGGATGFITYDAIRVKEQIPDRHADLLKLPDFFFQFYRSSLAFDHQTGKAVLATISEEYETGMKELDRLENELKQSLFQKSLPQMNGQRGNIEIVSDLSDEEFGGIVEKAKEYVQAGDVFQMVPSRTFRVKIKADPFQVYRALRQKSPAPYLFFFDLDGYAIAGASPEKIVSVQNGIVESTPLAGTRPKGSDPEELLRDPKEIAEHVMLVDLARNDVGAVSKPGSVKVAEFKQVHQFSHVMHIVSRVVGELDSKYDALDAFKASFPAGTLSGAPKVRAMELIDELETSRRGLYGGAIVGLDAKGNLTSCIAIRTTLIKDGVAYVRAGAGIVLDSVPQKEAEETRLKANTVLDALKIAEGSATV